jgi:hypothetical protein
VRCQHTYWIGSAHELTCTRTIHQCQLLR